MLDLISQVELAAAVNRTLHTHATPWEIAAWPMEFVDAVLAVASGGALPDEDD